MSKAKDTYNRKNYSQLSIRLEKELIAEFKERCDMEKRAYADVIRQLLKTYLKTP